MRWWSSRRVALLILALTAGALADSPARAQVVLSNDSWTSGQNAAFQAGFVAGEIAAVRLVPTEPCPCPLTSVRFLLGGLSTVQTVKLHVWDDSGGPLAPGASLFSGDFEVAGFDEAMHEIDLRDEDIEISGTVWVGIEFSHTGLPAIARDTDGNIASDRNFILDRTFGWLPSSILGVTGDWILRATIGAAPVVGVDDLRNDGWETGQSAAFQQGFVAGETAAVRLVPEGPCPCPVKRVRFLFGGDGGVGSIRTVTLRIWDDGAGTAAPGAELFARGYEIAGFDEALQEIDLAAENIEVAGPFRIGLELSHAGLPSVARDDDGDITPDSNFVDASGAGWTRSEDLGVQGDWILRAVTSEGSGAALDEARNDGWETGQLAAFQQGFVAGETAAVRLVPEGPCPCPLRRVRFLFGGDGGVGAIRTVTLRVWDDSPGTDAPGAELFSGDYEIAGFDEALQEIDLDAEGLEVTGPVRIGLELDHAGLPSVARDVDGSIAADQNFIDASGLGWVRSSSLGVQGDWILRGVFETSPSAVELSNDGWSLSAPAAFESGLAASDVAAVRLVPTGPCPCPVRSVRFLFGDAGSGGGATETATLRIWDDSAEAMQPGRELFSGTFPVTSRADGLQEIDLSGESLVVDGPVRVGLELAHSGLPTLARDADGVTLDRNFVQLSGTGWVESASEGVAGDWVLRLVLAPEPGVLALQLASLATLAAFARARSARGRSGTAAAHARRR